MSYENTVLVVHAYGNEHLYIFFFLAIFLTKHPQIDAYRTIRSNLIL